MRFGCLAVAASLLAASPAASDVTVVSETGFISRNAAQVPALPMDVWAELIVPSGWWNGEHTYSGESVNIRLDPVAGGCFCEALAASKGSVEHMRVIHADPGKLLRMSGALGPLQSEAVNGTLSITLKPVNGGTEVLWEYVVGGFTRQKASDIAAPVDSVLREQLGRLAARVQGSAVTPRR